MSRDRVATLEALRDALDEIHLGDDLPGASEARATAVELRNQIGDYLLPRLRRLDAPLLAVLGGSTGSGKSTITNSLAGVEVSPAGVLRPTTRSPTLICHPDDLGWFGAADVLPDLPRVTGEGTVTGAVLAVRTIDEIGPGLALIDAPDIDSIEEANRDLATQLLAAADLWLFVTTAVRYADAVPWDFLTRARDRGTALAVVINRLPVGSSNEIVPHLAGMLDQHGLTEVRVFPIEDAELIDGRLPETAIAPLSSMLTALAADAEERADVVRRTIDGAIASVPERARRVLTAAEARDAAGDELLDVVERQRRATAERIAIDLSGGALLRGEVLDRWQELIGTNEMMRSIQSRITAVRDRIGGFLRGQPAATAEVQGEITSTLEQLVIDHLDAMALAITRSWRELPAGRGLLGRDGDTRTDRAGADVTARIDDEIRAWQDDILDLVRSQGAGKRNMARAMAVGVNGVGVALMIVLFAQTGGVTGGEVAIASGTATVSQALLNAIFGEQAVRELAAAARERLLDRIGVLLDHDAERFRALVPVERDATERLAGAIDALA